MLRIALALCSRFQAAGQQGLAQYRRLVRLTLGVATSTVTIRTSRPLTLVQGMLRRRLGLSALRHHPLMLPPFGRNCQNEGANFTIEAVKTSICPAGTGGPVCHPTLDDGVLMQAYINAPCEIGTTKRYVHMAYATMTVDGIIYASRLDGRRADVNCTGSSERNRV